MKKNENWQRSILDKISGGLNMTLSAKGLGEICGLTAEEMNVLLKEEGFLSGEPGNYYPTALFSPKT